MIIIKTANSIIFIEKHNAQTPEYKKIATIYRRKKHKPSEYDIIISKLWFDDC